MKHKPTYAELEDQKDKWKFWCIFLGVFLGGFAVFSNKILGLVLVVLSILILSLSMINDSRSIQRGRNGGKRTSKK